MNYGKIENGNVRIYQIIVFENGGFNGSPSHEQWLEHGYLPIIDNRPPEKEGFYQESSFAIVDNQIVYTYNYVQNPTNYDNV